MLLPEALFQRGGLILDRPRCDAPAPVHTLFEILLDAIQYHAEVPVAQAIAQEQKVPGLERIGEHRGDSFVPRHANQKVNVIVFGDHVLVTLRLAAINRAMHFVDDRDRLEINIHLVRGNLTRLMLSMWPPQHPVTDARVGRMDYHIVQTAIGAESALDEVVIVGGDNQQRSGNISEEGVEQRKGIISVEDAVQVAVQWIRPTDNFIVLSYFREVPWFPMWESRFSGKIARQHGCSREVLPRTLIPRCVSLVHTQ
jgi:hypothetical protein